MNNNNKYNIESMGLNGYEKPVRVRYQVSNYFQLPVGPGIGPNTTLPKNICIAGEVIQRHKASCTCPLQHQIFHDYRIFQHFCHMTGFKSINIVLEVVRYNSPDLIRGGTSRENLCGSGIGYVS